MSQLPTPHRYRPAAFFALLIAYLATGKLCLLLALPPVYSTPLFPPAGLALAAVYLAGKRALPWIFVGAWLLNLWTGYTPASSVRAAAFAAAMGLAPVVQAMVGGRVLHRLLGTGCRFDQTGDLQRLFIAAPLLCLTSATLSIGALAALDLVEPDGLAKHWLTWWLGDTLGVLVFFPIGLVLAAEPRDAWRARRLSVAGPMLFILTLVLAFHFTAGQWSRQASMEKFQGLSDQFRQHILTRLDEQELLLQQMQALFGHGEKPPSREQFGILTQGVVKHIGAVQAIEWAPRIAAAERGRFEAAEASQLAGFEIKERDGQGRPIRAQPRPYYYPITYLEPMAGNEVALGFDLASTPERREALELALANDKLVATAPLRLLQDKTGQAAVLLLLPVKAQGTNSDMLLSVLKMGDFIEAQLSAHSLPLFVRLSDTAAGLPLYDNLSAAAATPLYSTEFRFAGRRYSLETAPVPQYWNQGQGGQTVGFLAAGLLGTGVLGGLLLLGTGYTARVESQVRERTQALLESEQRWHFALEGSGDGVWDWDVPAGEVLFSRRWYEIQGYAPGEIGPAIGDWERLVHPDDLPVLQRELQAHLRGETPSFACEHRVRCENGEYKWILGRGMVVSRDESGRPLRVVGTHSDISERKRLEAELQSSHDRLAKISQHVPGVIYQYRQYPDGRACFPYASDGIREIYEVTPEQVREDATPVFAVLHPDDHDAIVASIRESERTMQPWRLDYRVTLPSKGERWLSGHAKPERLAEGSTLWHGYISDITEKKALDRKLQENEQRLEFAFEGTGDGLWDWNISKGEVFFSKRWKEMLGYAEDEIGSDVEEWTQRIHPDDTAAVMADVQSCFDGATPHYVNEHRVLCKDGSYKWILDRGIIIDRDAAGQPTRMTGTHTDVTARRMAAEALRNAKALAEENARAKSEFLANMSHEIRTPMNGVIGLTQLALNLPASAELRDYLEKIAASSQNLLSILNDILDFSKLDAGQMPLELEPFDLDAMVDNLRGLFEAQIRAKQLDFKIQVQDGTPRDLVGDALRIQQVLTNLLSNAVKFTERGQVVLAITLQKIEDGHALLNFCVEDQGIGIAEEDQEKLFRAFSQVDGSITRRFGGTGLGLAISQSLLRLMDSRFSVRSALGQGSSFSFELRLGIAAEHLDRPRTLRRRTDRQAGELAHKLNEMGHALHGRTVLVVEDNEVNQRVVCEFLKLAGLTSVVANNGQEALNVLAQQRVDAVLMDMHMPVMGGAEATEKIRANPEFARLPIIALTAGATQEERQRCMNCGMNDFIAKPVKPETLLETLCRRISPAADYVAEPPLPAAEGGGFPDAPGFDLDYALELLGGDRELLLELLGLFGQSMEGISDKIGAEATAGNLTAARNHAHKLKGSAANCGAKALCDIVTQLENELQAGRFETATFAAFAAEFERTMATIAAITAAANA